MLQAGIRRVSRHTSLVRHSLVGMDFRRFERALESYLGLLLESSHHIGRRRRQISSLMSPVTLSYCRSSDVTSTPEESP